jgi:hypothetical protein
VGLTTDIQEAELKRVYRSAKKAGIGLKSALEQILDKVSEQAFDSRGSNIVSISGNGAAMQWEASESISQADYVQFFNRLDNLYEDAQVELESDGTTETDPAIFDRMRVLLIPKNEVWTDRSCLQV